MEQNRCSSSLDAMDLKVEPECIFNEQVHVKEEVVESLKEEVEWEDSAADVASLYAGHEVKDELVLGPEGLQPRDIAFTLFAQALAVTAQPKLKDCVVLLERIDDLEAPLGTDTRRDKRRVENNVEVGHKIQSNANISNKKETYVCGICKERFDLETKLMEHVMIHIHQSMEQEEICVADNAGVLAFAHRGCHRDHTYAKMECPSAEVHVKEEVVECLKEEEEEWEDSAADVASLYAGHEVKDELVLGPEGLQPRDIAFTVFAAQASAVRAQPKLKDCELPLERIDDLEAPLGTDTRRDKGRVGNNADVGHEIHNEKETYVCDICKKRFDLKTQLMEHVMIHIHHSKEQEEINVADNVHVEEEVVECLKEEAEWEALAVREQPVLRDCAVRLERIDSLEALLEGTRRVEHNADVGNRTHTTTNIATEKERYVCDICKKRFDLKTQLVEHVMTHIHRRTEREESMRGVARNAAAGGWRGEGREPTRARGYRYSCEICEKKFPAPSNLKRHERIHTGERPFACGICEKKFTQSSSLKTHERIHTEERPFACGICYQKFARSSHLKKHERTHTGAKHFSCRICKQKFRQLSALNVHERTHTGEKPFSCGICQQKFAQSSNLKVHERIHTGERPFACGICEKKFTQSSSLKTHERIHTEERPFACGICYQKFARSSHLKKHERTHTGAKHFSCRICKQKFRQLSALNVHERTHTGEKPFSCGICQQKFAQSSNLKVHERIHTGERPFACGICEKKFTRSSSLKTHERTHTGAKPFSCGICKQKFAHSSHLKRHERTHTRAQPYTCSLCKKQLTTLQSLKKHKDRIHAHRKPFCCDICQKRFAQKTTLAGHIRRHMTLLKD